MGYSIHLLDVAVVFCFQEWLSLLLWHLQEHQINESHVLTEIKLEWMKLLLLVKKHNSIMR